MTPLTEYTLIVILQLIGVGFHMMQKIGDIRKNNPSLMPGRVLRIFMQEDWNTLLVSVLVMVLSIVVHYIVHLRGITPEGFWANWYVIPGIHLLAGYAGQRLIYKYLGTAEKKAETISGKIENIATTTVETPNAITTTTTTEEIKPK